jgi:hypothetical protein
MLPELVVATKVIGHHIPLMFLSQERVHVIPTATLTQQIHRLRTFHTGHHPCVGVLTLIMELPPCLIESHTGLSADAYLELFILGTIEHCLSCQYLSNLSLRHGKGECVFEELLCLGIGETTDYDEITEILLCRQTEHHGMRREWYRSAPFRTDGAVPFLHEVFGDGLLYRKGYVFYVIGEDLRFGACPLTVDAGKEGMVLRVGHLCISGNGTSV